MYILTVTYPNSEGATFDWDYYREKHLPNVGETFGPHGLGYASVLKGEVQADGATPAFLAHTTLSFRDEGGAKAALASEGARALMDDSKNFTSATPIVQFNTAIP